MGGIRKKHSKDVKTVEKDDIISQLPESVIHHILSFIRCQKEAARTSILSKTWRNIWKSFPILTFDEESFLKTEVYNSKKKFIEFVDNSLQTYIVQKLLISKLVLRITPALNLNVRQWVHMAGEQRLRELDIHVETHPISFMYNPPLFLLPVPTLTGLRLNGVDLSNFQRFNNLQKLHLQKLHVDQKIIQELVSTSPLIMDLRIVECPGLRDLTISGFLKLEIVDLCRCCGLRSIELQVTSLQTFMYCGNKYLPCTLNMESCISLKRLTLEDGFMTQIFLYELLRSFPVLENLDLSRCCNFESINVPNVKLRCLALSNCTNLKTVDIHSVYPCSFDCNGSIMPFIHGRLCVREANFSFVSRTKAGVDDIPARNSGLQYFLETHCVQGFKIIVWFLKNIIIHDESKNIFIPKSPRIELHIIKSSTDAKDLLNGLLTRWHPERIIVTSSPSSDVPKALREIKRCEQPSCCSYNSSNRCWRHFLKDAKIVDILETEGTYGRFYGLNLKSSVDQITSMRLHWETSNAKRKTKRKTVISDKGL